MVNSLESNLGHPDDVTEGVLDGMAHHGSGSGAGDDVNLLEILNKCKKVVQRLVDFFPFQQPPNFNHDNQSILNC